MWSFIIAEAGPWLIGGAAAAIGLVVAYFRVLAKGRALERAKITEGQLKLREKYDEVDSRPRDPDSAYERLLDRSRKR